MAILRPKDFIQQVLIDELRPICDSSPYIAFALMAIGIEFLGKCLDTSTANWNEQRRGRPNFYNAITSLPGLDFYSGYEESLFEDIRCGFAHSFTPGPRYTLSSKNQAPHMYESGGRVNLRCENFYSDFKEACLHVINMTFSPTDKMNNDFLSVPGSVFSDSRSLSPGSSTESEPLSGIT